MTKLAMIPTYQTYVLLSKSRPKHQTRAKTLETSNLLGFLFAFTYENVHGASNMCRPPFKPTLARAPAMRYCMPPSFSAIKTSAKTGD